MIQRYLYTALTVGIEAITNDLRILEDLFIKNYGLSVEEVEAIKTAWTAHTPNVSHNYPRMDSQFPLYSIILSNEKETDHYLGDMAGQIEDEKDPELGTDILSALWSHSYQIWVSTEHPDLTIYYYEIAKSIILGTPFESAYDLFELSISGADLLPDPRYMPEHLFIRQITFGCSREFQRLDLTSRFAKAWKVGGIHVDRSGSSGEIGDVNDSITTYVAGDDDGEEN